MLLTQYWIDIHYWYHLLTVTARSAGPGPTWCRWEASIGTWWPRPSMSRLKRAGGVLEQHWLVVSMDHLWFIYGLYMDNLWIWLVVIPTPLKNMGLSVGMMKFPIHGTTKNAPNHQPDQPKHGKTYLTIWKKTFHPFSPFWIRSQRSTDIPAIVEVMTVAACWTRLGRAEDHRMSFGTKIWMKFTKFGQVKIILYFSLIQFTTPCFSTLLYSRRLWPIMNNHEIQQYHEMHIYIHTIYYYILLIKIIY